MEKKEIKKIIEAMLFAYGEKVSKKKLSEVLSINVREVAVIVDEMLKQRIMDMNGILIRQIDDGYQMCTNPEYFDYARILFDRKDSKTLSQAAYETLSIVAYNKNATRAKIESIRGVGSDSTISTLINKDLIEEAGRLDAPGRPVIYKTTDEFLRAFDIASPDELFPIDKYIDEVKEET